MNNYLPSPFPKLSSERLILRELEINDAPQMLKLRSNPELMQYIPRPLLENIDDAIQKIRAMHISMIKTGNLNWALCTKENPEMIGVMGFAKMDFENKRGEIGYMILKAHHNKGYVSEILPQIIQYAFEVMQLHSLEAIIDPDNIASEKVLIKLGFKKEAHFIENVYFDGKYLDSVHFSILNSKH